MDDRQTKLEELLAYQQHLLDELNSVVTEQQAEIQSLGKRLDRMTVRLDEVAELAKQRSENLPDERPPHY